MALAWYLVPFVQLAAPHRHRRYCAMDDYTAAIRADGGDWTETEVLGNQAIVKARASVATLQAVADDVRMRRIPLTRLDDSLSTLNGQQRNTLKQWLLDAGYTLAEVNARFPNALSTYTLGDVLRFLASRRRKPRYDPPTDAIVCDGVVVTPRPVDDVDAKVT